MSPYQTLSKPLGSAVDRVRTLLAISINVLLAVILTSLALFGVLSTGVLPAHAKQPDQDEIGVPEGSGTSGWGMIPGDTYGLGGYSNPYGNRPPEVPALDPPGGSSEPDDAAECSDGVMEIGGERIFCENVEVIGDPEDVEVIGESAPAAPARERPQELGGHDDDRHSPRQQCIDEGYDSCLERSTSRRDQSPDGDVQSGGPTQRVEPTSNGCGPEELLHNALAGRALRSALKWYAPEMAPACHKHDKCYATCGSDRKACDESFCESTRQICVDALGTGRSGLLKCLRHAQEFCRAVTSGGQEAWDTAQQAFCTP